MCVQMGKDVFLCQERDQTQWLGSYVQWLRTGRSVYQCSCGHFSLTMTSLKELGGRIILSVFHNFKIVIFPITAAGGPHDHSVQ